MATFFLSGMDGIKWLLFQELSSSAFRFLGAAGGHRFCECGAVAWKVLVNLILWKDPELASLLRLPRTAPSLPKTRFCHETRAHASALGSICSLDKAFWNKNFIGKLTGFDHSSACPCLQLTMWTSKVLFSTSFAFHRSLPGRVEWYWIEAQGSCLIKLEPYNFVERREWCPLSWRLPWWAQCISYVPDVLNMAEELVLGVWFASLYEVTGLYIKPNLTQPPGVSSLLPRRKWHRTGRQWCPVLSVQKVLCGFVRGTRRWPMYFPMA